MRAVPTWVDKVHDRDRNEQVIMYLIYFAMHSAGGRLKKMGVQTILLNMSYVCRSMPVMLGDAMAPPYICTLADQLTLPQPGGADYSHHIIM